MPAELFWMRQFTSMLITKPDIFPFSQQSPSSFTLPKLLGSVVDWFCHKVQYRRP